MNELDSMMTFKKIINDEHISFANSFIRSGHIWECVMSWDIKCIKMKWGLFISPRINSIMVKSIPEIDDEKLIEMNFDEANFEHEFIKTDNDIWLTLELEPVEIMIDNSNILIKWRR